MKFCVTLREEGRLSVSVAKELRLPTFSFLYLERLHFTKAWNCLQVVRVYT